MLDPAFPHIRKDAEAPVGICQSPGNNEKGPQHVGNVKCFPSSGLFPAFDDACSPQEETKSATVEDMKSRLTLLSTDQLEKLVRHY